MSALARKKGLGCENKMETREQEVDKHEAIWS